MKIVAEFYTTPDGGARRNLYAIDEDGNNCPSVTATLLDFIYELHPPADAIFEAMLAQSAEGKYLPNDASYSDFNLNDKLVWIRPPEALPGHVLISNEYVPEYSVDDGVPQSFSFESFYAVLKHWREFLLLSENEGSKVLELDLPQASSAPSHLRRPD